MFLYFRRPSNPSFGAVTNLTDGDILQARFEGQLELLRYFKETYNGTQSKVTVTLDDFAKRLELNI